MPAGARWGWTLTSTFVIAAVAGIAAFALGQVGCGGGSNGSCACPTLYAPVCGVDGKTYSSSCVADCGKIAVAHDGTCATDGGAGGGAGQGGAGSGTGGHGGSSGATCPGPAPTGCCLKDDDCPIAAEGGQICVTAACTSASVKAGVCKPRIPSDSTQCWSDADCFGAERCVGAQVCPCGAACLRADQIGQCVK